MSQQRALLIFELNEASGNDWMVGDLKSGLRARGYGVTQLAGLFQRIPHGGFRMKRLCNALWMLLALPFSLFAARNVNFVVVRSTPPLLHLPVASLCHLFKLPCVFWLMDAHPEIEQRLWRGRPVLSTMVGVFTAWERRVLSSFSLVVVLDQAMQELVQKKCSGLKTMIHPTWGTPLDKVASGASTRETGKEDVLRLAYVGNFGRGHLWETMVRLVELAARKKHVRIIAIGVPDGAGRNFEELSSITNVEVVLHPRQRFHEVVELLKAEAVDYGCVAMRGDLVGCLSPSKFSSYLEAGVPLLYIGPEKTNAWRVCAQFGGGIHISEDASDEDCGKAVLSLLSATHMKKCSADALRARDFYRSFDGESLAEMICASLK